MTLPSLQLFCPPKHFVVALAILSYTLVASAGSAPAPPEPESAPETYLLRYHFKPGDFIHYEVEYSSTVNLAARDHRQTMRQQKESRKHYRVVSVDSDGVAVLEPMIDYVLMEAQSDNDAPVIFDSTKAAPKAFEKIAKSIGKAVVRVRSEPTGKVSEVLPLGEKSLEDEHDVAQVAFLIAFPEQKLAAGDSWNDDYETRVNVATQPGSKLLKPVQIRRRYTLQSVKGGIATIQFRTYPLNTDSNPQIQLQLVQQSLSGAIEFDLEKGFIRQWQSGGSGEVFNAFGPTSSMRSEWKTIERFVAQPARKPSGPIGPVGPPVPGTASL